MSAINPLKLDFILLHYALKDKKFTLELSKEIDPDFLDPKLQLFYSILMKNFTNPLIRDILSLQAIIDYCEQHNIPPELQSRIKAIHKQATELKFEGVAPVTEDFRYYLTRVKRRKNLEVATEGVSKIAAALTKDPNDPEAANTIFKSTLLEINAINRVEVYDEGSIGEDVDNMIAEYEAIELNPAPFLGVTVGFPSYDERSGGLHKGELTLIGGMEGSGKSMLMMNWGVNAWLGSNTVESQDNETGHNVLYFTLEMPRSNKGEFTQGSYLNKRVLSCVSGLKLWDIQHGKLSTDDKQRLRQTADFIKNHEKRKKFHVVDIPRGATVGDIEAKYLELKEKLEGIDLVVIDYLGIMAAGKDADDHLMQGQIAEAMHEFARTYDVPVLSAVQLNRPSGANNSLDSQKYNTNRVARSAMISQNANNVLMIETRDNEHERAGMIVHITKMRDGEKGSMILTKRFECMRVIDEVPPGEGDEDESEDISILENDFEELDHDK